MKTRRKSKTSLQISFLKYKTIIENSKKEKSIKRALKGLAKLIAKYEDYTNSLPYLEGKVRSIANRRPAKGEEFIDLSNIDSAVLDAMVESGQMEVLVEVLMKPIIRLPVRVNLLEILSGSVLDIELYRFYKRWARTDDQQKEFFDLLTEVYTIFKIKPPAILMEKVLTNKITLDHVKSLKTQIEGKTLPQLLEFFHKDQSDEGLMTYFMLYQGQFKYSFGLRFALFKKIVFKAFRFLFSGHERFTINPNAKDKLRGLFRKNIPRHAEEIIEAMDEGRVIVPKASGLVDDNGNFVPQPLRVDVGETADLDNLRENFAAEYNKRFIPFILILYLAATIKGILSKFSNEAVQINLDNILKSIQSLGDLDKAFKQLKDLHAQTLRLLPKFTATPEQDLPVAVQEEINGFLTRLTKRLFAQNYALQAVLAKRKQKLGDAAILDSLMPYDLDTIFRSYENKTEYPKNYQGVKSFAEFIDRTWQLILESNNVKDLLDQGLSAEIQGVILREMKGHFQVIAEGFEKHDNQETKSEVIYFSLLAKKDMIPFVRFADGAQCCLTSNQSMEVAGGYTEYMSAVLLDEGTQVFLIHGETRPVGFILWHFAYDSTDDLWAISLRLYLKQEYHSKKVVQNIWSKVEYILPWLGVKTLGQSDEAYGLAQHPPAGYKKGGYKLKRIQTVKGQSTVLDLYPFRGNVSATATLHVKDLQPRPQAASGFQIPDEHSSRISEALKAGMVIKREDATSYQAQILDRLAGKLEKNSPLAKFIREAKVKLVVIRPNQKGLFKHGLNVDLSGTGFDAPGRDVYATFTMEKDGDIKIYISEYTSHAPEVVIMELIAHELYEVYVKSGAERDINFELLINQEIEKAKAWEATLDAAEREDLGLMSDNAKNPHARARAFARLAGEPSQKGKGTRYTDFLRASRRKVLALSSAAPRFDLPLSSVMPMERAMELMAYVEENKKDPLEFLREILQEKDFIIWNYATFSQPVFANMKRLLAALLLRDDIQVVGIPVGVENQGGLDTYLASGEAVADFKAMIAKQMFPGMPEEFQQVELVLEIFQAIYLYNQTRSDAPVQLTAIPSLTAIHTETEEAIQAVKKTVPEGKKAIFFKYYISIARKDEVADDRTYLLAHIDRDIGFIGNKINGLAYALNYLIQSRSGDFVLALDERTPFKDEEIQPFSEAGYVEEAIQALQATGTIVSEEMKRGIQNTFLNWQQEAALFNYFQVYDAVLISLPGDNGRGDVEQKTQPPAAPEEERERQEVAVNGAGGAGGGQYKSSSPMKGASALVGRWGWTKDANAVFYHPPLTPPIE